VLLENLDFQVADGEIFVILGGSGCGKSTLLRHLIGLEQPLRGTIRVRGIGDPALGSAPLVAGVMFQSGALFGSLTLRENVALPLETWTDLGRDAIDAVARSKLALVGLAGFENHLPAAISGGMRKRAAIARALALEPPLLYLDEPSAGLDPVTAVELDELLLALCRGLGTTLVVVTHELQSIFKIAGRCIMLDAESRSIIARGAPSELRASSDPRVSAFFNRRPRSPV
jgi:phospholipid/cholesterol/gamma-HCH transport system ATP-binding protein